MLDVGYFCIIPTLRLKNPCISEYFVSIIPYDCGGPTEIENAQLLHKWCNRSKGNKMTTIDDFVDDSEEEELSESE